jgi:uridine kinase
LITAITELKKTGETIISKYDKLTGTYPGETETIVARKLIIVESFLLFSAGVPMDGEYSSGKKKEPVLPDPSNISKQILDLIEYRIFVDCDENVAWLRRLARDAQTIPRTYEQSNELWIRDAWPAAQQYIYSLKKLKKDDGIFDAYIDNTLLRVNDVDCILSNISYIAKQPIKPGYAHDLLTRQNWIEERYSRGTVQEAAWMRKHFNGRLDTK